MENSIKEAFELKLKKYDFLNGDEQYKYKYTNDETNIYQFSNYNSIFLGKLIRYFEEKIFPMLSKLTLLRAIRKLLLNILKKTRAKI